MKLKFLKLNMLSAAEKKLIIKVTLLSTAATALVIVVFWLWQYFSMQSRVFTLNKLSGSNSVVDATLLPIDIEAHRILSNWYKDRDQPEKAIVHLERIQKVLKNNCEFHAELGAAYLDAAQFEKALKQLQTAEGCVTENDSAMIEILSKKGIALFYSGKIDEGKKVLSDCIGRFGKAHVASCYLGIIELFVNPGSHESEKYFKQAILWDSTNTEAWYQLGRYYMDQKEYLSSRNHLLHTLRLDPLHARAHSRLGMVYYYLEEPTLAEKEYGTALALNPDDYNTLYNLGELYYSLGNKLEALKQYVKVIERNQEHAPANFKAGLVCLENNMFKEAVGYFEKTMMIWPNDIRTALQLAASYERLKMVDNAIKWYQFVLKNDELNILASQKIKYLTQDQRNKPGVEGIN